MYLTHFGLKYQPFTISPDPRFLFLSEAHKEGLAHLTYGITQRKGFVVITGEVGTGKTTLIHALLSDIPQKVRLAFISNPTVSKNEFFLLLSEAYGLGGFENKARFLIKFTEFLEKAYENNENVVLIVDEAHSLPMELLEEIRLLSNLETPHHKLVNIILVGQPELDEKLNTPELRPLRQRISLYYHLSTMTKEETADYIKTRLVKAGAQDLDIFTDKALDRIYSFTRGVPRLINVLCDHALLSGFVKDQRRVDDSIIEECAKELDLKGNKREDVPRKRGRRKRTRPRGRQSTGERLRFLFQILVILVLVFAGAFALWWEVMGK